MSASDFLPSCPDCGAPQAAGASCRACFEALLAFENERPSVFGAVHHLTVACYFLQHPTGYGREVLDAWRALVADALDGRATPRELRQRSGRRFAGARRVRDPAATLPPDWPAAWPMTVADVLTPAEPPPSNEEYTRRALAWAAAVRRTLGA